MPDKKHRHEKPVFNEYSNAEVRINNDFTGPLGRGYGGSVLEYKCSKCGLFEAANHLFTFGNKVVCAKCASLMNDKDRKKLAPFSA